MLRGNKELWLAFLAMLLITGLYGAIYVAAQEIPPACELFGHGIGIIGFILMLMTETLYSLRKRSRSVKWGKMSTWLQSHIFTGLVGPIMVLLHYLLEVQRAGRRDHSPYSHHCGQRIYWTLYLHPHPAHDGWSGDRRDAFPGGAQTGAPADGALAHDPYPDWDGIVRDGICPYRRGVILRHVLEVGRRDEKKQSSRLSNGDAAWSLR